MLNLREDHSFASIIGVTISSYFLFIKLQKNQFLSYQDLLPKFHNAAFIVPAEKNKLEWSLIPTADAYMDVMLCFIRSKEKPPYLF